MAFFQTLIDWFRNSVGGIVYIPGSAINFPGTPEIAMRLSAVYACTRLISETVACLPCELLQHDGNGGKFQAIDDPRYYLVKDQANGWQDMSSLLEMVITDCINRGNGYAHILRSQGGGILSLTRLDPTHMKVGLKNGERTYEYSPLNGDPAVTLSENDVLHIIGPSIDGVMGTSTITYARDTIELGLQQVAFGLETMRNGTYTNLAIKMQGKLSSADREQLRTDFSTVHGGSVNAGKPIILDGGKEAVGLGLTPEDAQWIAGRNLTLEEICRFYRVFPYQIGSGDAKQSYSSNESNNESFKSYTLLPWVKKIEAQLNRKLLLPSERGKLCFEFDFSNLLRANQQARYTAYQIGVQNGFLKVNEVRAWESLPAVEGGDILKQPLNMGTIQGAGNGN